MVQIRQKGNTGSDDGLAPNSWLGLFRHACGLYELNCIRELCISLWWYVRLTIYRKYINNPSQNLSFCGYLYEEVSLWSQEPAAGNSRFQA